MNWPFGKREVHVHLDAALLHEVRAGDTLLVSMPSDWSPGTISQFVEFVRRERFLPEGARLLLIPSNHAPVVLRAEPEPKGDEEANHGHQ